LLIGAGGVLAELLLACIALLAWSLLPDGPGRTAAFMLASATWITTLVVNLNPFMRFDGYFLISDFWEVDNLQGRAFALCRWRLREFLFGYGAPAPEPWSPKMQRRLLGVWLMVVACGVVFRDRTGGLSPVFQGVGDLPDAGGTGVVHFSADHA
jgi:putative peptide zinc metalloprotease protein